MYVDVRQDAALLPLVGEQVHLGEGRSETFVGFFREFRKAAAGHVGQLPDFLFDEKRLSRTPVHHLTDDFSGTAPLLHSIRAERAREVYQKG